MAMRRIPYLLAAGLLLLAGPSLASADAKEEANKKLVVEFYEKALNQKDFEAAAKYFGNRYVQHNPNAPDGIEGFKTFLGFLREKFPQSKSEIKRAFADGDYVIIHVVDIFKLEDGKIVEHWDVVQPIPEKAANRNTMF